MSRSKGPEPFIRADRGLWYVQVHGRQHNLGRDEVEARRRWHALMAAPPPVAGAGPDDPLVAAAVDEFLTWTQQQRAGRTYVWYRNYLQEFVTSLPEPAAFPVSRLRPLHVEEVGGRRHGAVGASCRHGAIRSVQRCFRWAEEQGYIELSPVRHAEKPTPKRREKVITPEEYRTILAHYKEVDPFRDVLVFAWETGAGAGDQDTGAAPLPCRQEAAGNPAGRGQDQAVAGHLPD